MSSILSIIGIILFLAIGGVATYIAIRLRRRNDNPNIMASNLSWGVVGVAVVGIIMLAMGMFFRPKPDMETVSVIEHTPPPTTSSTPADRCIPYPEGPVYAGY